MTDIDFIRQLSQVNFIIKILELCCITLCTYYTFNKIANKGTISILNKSVMLVSTPIIAIIFIISQNKIDKLYGFFSTIVLISFINKMIFKDEIVYELLVTIIAYCISYAVYLFSVMIAFIPNVLLRNSNDYIGLITIVLIYLFIIYNIFRIKKIKYGISFLKSKLSDAYYSIIVFSIGSVALFSFIVLKEFTTVGLSRIGLGCIILIVSIYFTIKQALKLYYKQNLLTKELEQTKKELEDKKQEIDKLEKENLEFSKTSHSLAHKQKALEYKLEQLIKTGIDKESKDIIKEEIENVSKEVFKEPNELKLAKTEIESIDNMFSYMQSECIKNNIKFELQVVGNIYYMINNLISENDLEILIADHLKDAIIAINNSDNSNRSILVRIGKIDNVYSLYIYDSGIEFTKEVLDNLGKKPITTHADTSSTDIRFMNTFDTLNKTKASLIINEIGKPCEDNYTKVLIFKFDNQNEFKVNSYKNEVVI